MSEGLMVRHGSRAVCGNDVDDTRVSKVLAEVLKAEKFG